jgi:pseudaminic acid cytidylyltransferase
MGRRLIAVIPARGGSKRIPGKNIRPFEGMPIIAYTIAAARESGLFEQIVVSTDDPATAEIAQRYGATIPFLRDAALADDFTPVSEVTCDVLARMDGDGATFQSVAQLMPNCPLRSSKDVVDSYEQFARTAAKSQISVVRYGWQNPWWAMRQNEQHELEPIFKEQMTARSQDLPELYCPTGAIWWAQTEVLRRTKSFHTEGKTGWEIPWQRGVDIDTLDDWMMAEVLFKQLNQQ